MQPISALKSFLLCFYECQILANFVDNRNLERIGMRLQEEFRLIVLKSTEMSSFVSLLLKLVFELQLEPYFMCLFMLMNANRISTKDKDKSPEVPFHGITSPYSYFEVI